MEAPRTPQDEQSRLDTLQSLAVLDTRPEERFDRYTRMAKRLFGVPIALISLIDSNRQWFKSCIGLEVRETARDISFCGHAILGNEPFIIPDASADPRFADNPLVLGDPFIRFYAGCPLAAPNGHKLGTLCIIDREPRHLEPDQLEALSDLAAMAERELVAVHLATVDELTGISNRRGFVELARHSLHLCARQNLPAALVFIDLDKFKPINDRFGHAAGDRALIDFSRQLAGVCREADVFGRLGGDEFAMLLVNTVRQHAEDVVDRLRDALGQHNRTAGQGYDILFSHGIVEFDPEVHPGIDALLEQGDAMMYRSKRSRT